MNTYLSFLSAGQSLIFPTETVYGIGCDATNSAAIKYMYQLKNRPNTQPTTIFLPDIATAHLYGVFNATASKLAEQYWPGPLTLILPLNPNTNLAPDVTGNTNTVGIRIPNDTFILDLLKRFGKPIACTSANKSGHPSPARAADIDLPGARIIDGDDRCVHPPSTIIDCTSEHPRIIRSGAIKI